MNTPVRRIAIAVMAMILLLMANLTYVQVVKAGDYRDDPRNKRVLLAEYSRKRGQISAEGTGARQQRRDRRPAAATSAQYPDGPVYAPVTGYYSVELRLQRHRAGRPTPCSTAATTGCSAAGCPT